MTGNTRSSICSVGFFAGVVALPLSAAGCSGKTEGGGITPQTMADNLYIVLSADRATYATDVVNRLQDKEKVIKADEHYEDTKALPLPAQMFRMGAERVQKYGASSSS